MNPPQIDRDLVIAHGLIAAFGGLAHSLSNKKYKLIQIVTSIVISSFTGVLAGLFAVYFLGNNFYLTTAISGAFGYAGTEGLKYLIDVAKKTVDIKVD